MIPGGLGSQVLEYVNRKDNSRVYLTLGFKDEFIPHGDVNILYKLNKLDADGICSSIEEFLTKE